MSRRILTARLSMCGMRQFGCARLGLKLYLQSALAFDGNSLYRTRRFRGLWVAAQADHKAAAAPRQIESSWALRQPNGPLGDFGAHALLQTQNQVGLRSRSGTGA